jgi:hypothetical protein
MGTEQGLVGIIGPHNFPVFWAFPTMWRGSLYKQVPEHLEVVMCIKLWLQSKMRIGESWSDPEGNRMDVFVSTEPAVKQ